MKNREKLENNLDLSVKKENVRLFNSPRKHENVRMMRKRNSIMKHKGDKNEMKSTLGSGI